MIRSFLNIQFTSYVLFVYRLLLEMPFTMWDFMCVMYLVTQLCLTPWDPMDCSLPDSSVQDFSAKNTAVGCHALLQGIFPTKKMNPGLPHCRIFFFFYHLSHQGSLWDCMKTSWLLRLNRSILFRKIFPDFSQESCIFSFKHYCHLAKFWEMKDTGVIQLY